MLRGYDPFRDLEGIVRRERELGFNSTFYFLFDHQHVLDGPEVAAYERYLPAAVSEVLEAGGEVGVHGSTVAASSLEQLEKERARCRAMTGLGEIGVRFHNLRLLPGTFGLVEQAGFAYDTTLGFAEHPGWRHGFTYPYRPYDLTGDRVHDFIEIPLIILDATFSEERYLNLPASLAREKIFGVLETLKKWRGAGAICWHNSTFDPNLSLGYSQLYWDMLVWISEHNGIGVSAGRLAAEWRRLENLVQQ
jgi:hypothetical protein